VHAALLEIISTVGQRDREDAANDLRDLVRNRRYCRSIY
jgi:sulfite reductase alpha subunit-like flavoprotein